MLTLIAAGILIVCILQAFPRFDWARVATLIAGGLVLTIALLVWGWVAVLWLAGIFIATRPRVVEFVHHWDRWRPLSPSEGTANAE